MRTPRRHRGGTLRIDRLAGLYRLYHVSPRLLFAASYRHIGSIERIARGASIAPEPRGLVEDQLVWLGFSASAREMTTDALQLLPVYFLVPADRLDRLFHIGPAQLSGSGDMAGAGLAGVLLGEQLAVRAVARGLDRVQLCDRPAVDLETAAPPLAFCGPH